VIQITLVVFTSADLLVDLATNLGVSLGFFLDKGEDIELGEAL